MNETRTTRYSFIFVICLEKYETNECWQWPFVWSLKKISNCQFFLEKKKKKRFLHSLHFISHFSAQNWTFKKMEAEQFSLVWNSFPTNLSSGLYTLLTDEHLVDVTLTAEGQILRAHKLILSVCSSYFRELFEVSALQRIKLFHIRILSLKLTRGVEDPKQNWQLDYFLEAWAFIESPNILKRCSFFMKNKRKNKINVFVKNENKIIKHIFSFHKNEVNFAICKTT